MVYVMLPADGKDHRGREYEGSGMWARDAFSEALTNRGTRTIEATAVRSIEQSLADGTAAGAAFVVLPDISYWADHMTEWSGTPDRITLRVRVLETPAGRSIDDREMKASSKWATFGGDHPQDLLPQLASDWAESIVVR